MALDAEASSVITLVLRHIALFVVAGIAAGALLSLWAVQFVESLVWGLEPRDSGDVIAAAATLALVSAVAGGVPAWRASRINPAHVLKQV